MRRFGLASVLILSTASGAFAFDHPDGSYGRYGGWGTSRWFGAPGFSASTGFSSFGVGVGGVGNFSYYNGPAGGFYPPVYGGYYAPYYGYPVAPGFGYSAPLPIIVDGPPVWPPLNPANNPVLQERLPVPQNQAGDPPADLVNDGPLFIKPSNAEAKRKSLRYQSQGDEYFVKMNYLQAYARYKQACAAAPDRPEPRFRLAVTLAALGRFGPASDEIKRLVRLDPQWPAHGDRLDDLFGVEHNLSKNSMLQRTAEWVREDVRDPDRLYLMGVLLHFNEDVEKARKFFETASLLSDSPGYVRVFLDAPARPAKPAAPVRPDPQVEPDVDEAPTPKPLADVPVKKPATALVGPSLPPAAPARAESDVR